jgi:AcrR family transcriptional regulator
MLCLFSNVYSGKANCRSRGQKMKKNIVDKTKEKYVEYQKRHKELIHSAIKIFNSRGYKGATTAAIAKEAGISEHTMYQHFSNKKELFLACHDTIINLLMEGYRKIYKNNIEDEVGYLKGTEQFYREFVLNNPEKSMFFFQMYSYKSDPDVGSAVNSFIIKSIDAVEKMVTSGRKKGNITSQLSDRALAALFIGEYFKTVFMKNFFKANELEEIYSIYMNDLFKFK